METLTLYIIKSIAISGLLAAWYMLALRGRSLHHYNRFYLLTALVVSITLPFLHFRSVTLPASVVGHLAPVSLTTGDASAISDALPSVQQVSSITISWPTVATIIAGAISLLLLGILLFRVTRLLFLCSRSASTKIEGADLIITDHPNAPFTFLNYLVWNRTMSMNTEIGSLIVRHELTHIAQRHTYDKLFCQALTCVFWFNPFYWLIQKELSLVHEFIADEQAVTDRDTETFSLMLLHSYGNGSFLKPQHHFTTSPVRRRLTMLQNMAAPSFSALRRYMALPLLAGTIFLFAFSVHSGVPNSHIARAKKKMLVLVDAAHGGLDAGGQHDGRMEKDICLAYALRMKQLAPQYNIEVRLTRKDDKDLPLSSRVALADKMRPDLFVSLHVGDEPGTEKEKGDIDIYISNRNPHAAQCNTYGGTIFQALEQDGVIPGAGKCDHAAGVTCDNCRNASLQQRTSGARVAQKEGIYVLKNIQQAAMVIVLGNIKNAANMQHLAQEKHVDEICNALLKGIVAGSEENVRTGMNTRTTRGSSILATLQGKPIASAPACGPAPRTAQRVNVGEGQ